MLAKILIANYVDHQTLSLYSPEKVNWENKTQYFRLRLIDKICPELNSIHSVPYDRGSWPKINGETLNGLQDM